MHFKFIFQLLLFFCLSLQVNQVLGQTSSSFKSESQGLYFYWGWNLSWYSQSDLSFSGDHYDFELSDVTASDRQSYFLLKTYFHPKRFSVPQFNTRIGYKFKDHWDVSLGVDHMKYVLDLDQTVKINGYIEDTESNYDRVYENDDIILSEDFLLYEHTDGLNYINVELRRSNNLYKYKWINVSSLEGFGLGGLLPKTNSTLLNKERYDDYHLSGFGFAAILGLQIDIFDHLFVQSEGKVGYIQMGDIRTTLFPSDKASQSFWFGQWNLVFGVKTSFN